MNQQDLKTKIAETLHRNLAILSAERGGGLGESRFRYSEISATLDACAANLAQILPELVLSEPVSQAVTDVRKREREMCAEELDALADEISEESARDAQTLRRAAAALRAIGSAI